MKKTFFNLLLSLLITLPVISCSEDEDSEATPNQETQVYLTNNEKGLDQRFYGVWEDWTQQYAATGEIIYYHSFSENSNYVFWSGLPYLGESESGVWWTSDTVLFINEKNSTDIKIYSFKFSSTEELHLKSISNLNDDYNDTLVLRK